MDLLLKAFLSVLRRNEIYVGSIALKEKLEKDIEFIIRELKNQGWEWALSELILSSTEVLGKEKAYRFIKEVSKDYSGELTPEQSSYLNNKLNQMYREIRDAGINIDHNDSLRKRAERTTSDTTERYSSLFGNVHNQRARLNNTKYTNTSYSGSDIVATINVPGKGPIVFGELSNISYSILREKFPVRALGRVTMKGFTRGMRMISGILSFTVFDESVVYRCMDELKRQGYNMLMDEMPLFDVTITAANEFGSKSKLTIYGVSTYTEGMVMSVNDIITQNVYEFYAIDIDPMHRI